MKYKVSKDISDNLLNIYLEEEEIAVDTELHGLQLYRDEICLIQLCDSNQNVCLIKPEVNYVPPNLKHLLTNQNIIKVFHFALTDVAFFKTSLNIDVTPYHCTKIMSKLIRTYTQGHGLKDLTQELLGHEVNKDQQQTNWGHNKLSVKQLEYAAKDVLELIRIYRILKQMMEKRPPLNTGTKINELNDMAQSMLPGMVELLINGYGDKSKGWETSLFSH